MTLRLFAFLMLGFLFLPACKPSPKISAMEMERQLGQAIYDLNQSLNNANFDKANNFVAEDAEPVFEVLLQGFRDGKYNLVMSHDSGKIDYVDSSAVVQMHLILGTYASGKPQGTEVDVQNHLWKYGIGGWKWSGPASK